MDRGLRRGGDIPNDIRTVRTSWQAAIFVCGKCSRRVGGGFGKKGRTPLAKALRKLGNGRRGRKAGFGVVETGCFKLCPRHAVVSLNGAEPGVWRIVRAGTPVINVARALGLNIDDDQA